MKREKDGKLSTEGGIRRKYRKLLDPRLFLYPRRTATNRPHEWYVDGHLAERPLFGIYALAKYAEYLLHMVRFRPGPERGVGLAEAAAFFAATRRSMQGVLSTTHIASDPPRPMVARMRKTVKRLISLAVIARAAVPGREKKSRGPLTPPAVM